MSVHIIFYDETLDKAITLSFRLKSSLDLLPEKYQAIYFPDNSTVYCSNSRWNEFRMCDTIKMKKEFFQKRVWTFEPGLLPASFNL